VAREFGGPVSGNKPYLVGERGPELFVPGSSGTIKPNSDLLAGKQIVHNQPINISVNGKNLTQNEIIDAVVKGIRQGNKSLIRHLRSAT
jgi:hypothetical protein